MDYKQPVFILSYPRSGTNWTRYIIQHIYPKNITDAGNINFVHHHFVDNLEDLQKYQLVFCLRDYREAVIRNTREYQCVPVIDNSELSWKQLIEIDHAKTTSDPGGTTYNYMENLRIYDEWEGDKYMVRYEEMIADPAIVIAELAWFLHVMPGEFLAELPFHQSNSLSEYHNRHGSYTKGESARFHQDLISANTRDLLDRRMRSFGPELYDKYLKQYRK